jgi:hypothetical protein
MQLMLKNDGTAGPVTWPNGDINVLAWNYYAGNKRLVMALGPDATPAQDTGAVCADGPNTSIPIEEDSYTLASTHYGWDVATNPSAVLLNGSCPNGA